MKRALAAGVIVAAVAGAAIPLPRPWIERWYSSGLYPRLQHAATTLSNLVPIALFDVLLIAAMVTLALTMFRQVRARGWSRGLARAAAKSAVAAAAVYVAFLILWGLNYRRVPLAEKLVFDPARITRAAARSLGDVNVSTLNRLHAAAHQEGLSLPALAAVFNDTVRGLGGAGAIVPGRPKQTVLLGAYFHQIAVSGMTDPFFLETLVAPDLLDVERPFVVAHEWAHLAGYADESEANFVAWLTCRHGDPLAQYSGALSMLGYAAPSRPLRDALDAGPKSDLYAIQHRYAQTSPVLRAAAREGYDRYLKANRVERGVESYDAVVQLILGTKLDAAGYPVRRDAPARADPLHHGGA